MKGVNIFLADGFEETEAIATFDMLKRGGAPVKTVALGNDNIVTGAHGLEVVADIVLSELGGDLFTTPDPGDVMVFPGGMPGATNLAACRELMDAASKHFAAGGAVAAICAAPGLVVSKLPGIAGRRFTCYDGFESYLETAGAVRKNLPVVTDGNLITGRGPGCAVAFGLEIVRYLYGGDAADEVSSALLG